MLSSLNFEVKTQQYFVSSSDMFLKKKTLLKIWLNPALNLTIFVDSSLIPRIEWQRERTLGRRLKLTSPENTITYHNVLCLSPQNFA